MERIPEKKLVNAIVRSALLDGDKAFFENEFMKTYMLAYTDSEMEAILEFVAKKGFIEKKKLCPKEKRIKIIELYQQGITQNKIRKELNVNHYYLKKILKEENLT